MGFLDKAFYHTGKASAQRPCTSILIGLLITAIGTIGFVNFRSTADPQALWVAPGSRSAVEQDYFAREFGFFFRINTGWISPMDPTGDPVEDNTFKHPYLDLMYWLQYYIIHDTAELNGLEFTLNDFCYKPITGEGCLVESPMQYFKSNYTYLESKDNAQIQAIATCVPQDDQTGRTCFDAIGTPVLTYAVFGGLSCQNTLQSACDTCDLLASAMQFTFLLNNNKFSLNTAEEWERQVFIRNVKTFNYALGNDYHTAMDGPMEGISYNQDLIDQINQVLNVDWKDEPYFTVKADYLAERSIEDNIVLESAQNASVVVISYLLMLVYVSIAIGFFPSMQYMSFGLGLTGIIVVIFSLLTSIGVTFYFNHEVTMISLEVVPFLILAIGVDNIFLICRAERNIPDYVTAVDERIGFAMKEIGPSIFTAAFCESIAFFIGLLTDVPALQDFCLVAAIGVIADFLLQITIFVAALSIERRRLDDNRRDLLFCCCKENNPKPRREELVRPNFQKYYVPIIFKKRTMMGIFGITIGLSTVGVFSCFKLLLGLNQNVSLVEYSDTYDYFETLYTYGEAGPPAYLVFKNVDYTNQENLDQMNLIAAQLATLNDTVLAPVYSWTGAYQNFITTGAVWSEACGSEEAAALSFDGAMALFVNIGIDGECCQSYGICGEQFSLDVIFDDLGVVRATRYRFQHQVQKTQEDYIKGLVETRKVCDDYATTLTTYPDTGQMEGEWDFPNMDYKPKRTHLQRATDYMGLTEPIVLAAEEHEDTAPTTFAYSLYYVYYDQYTYIRGVLFQNVFIGIGAIVVAMQVLSSLWLALIIALCVFLIFFELMGVMWMMNIVLGGYPAEMNAVFVVNLVTSLGFGVEFCNHIGMNFLKQKGTKVERAQKAMNAMGSSVVVGIASTKLLGILVLAFAPSTLFKLYYFRMYLFIILLGVFNGLCLLPVLLALIGPPQDPLADLEKKAEQYEMRKAMEEKNGYRIKDQ